MYLFPGFCPHTARRSESFCGGSNAETRVEKRGSAYALHRPMRIGTASRMQHVRALGRACTPVPNFPADVIFQDYFLFTAEEKKDTI